MIIMKRKVKPIALLDDICILLLAICPILQHYKGPFVNAAVTSLIVVFPFTVYKLYRRRRLLKSNIGFVLPLILYFLYKVVDHGTNVTEFGQAIVFSVLVIAIAHGCFNTHKFIRYITIISITASIFIILQYICYYLLHFHVQLVPTSLLLDKSNQWILGAQTGRAGITGRTSRFYRPSAFFLEPSHMFIYMFTPLVLNMLSRDPLKDKKATVLLLTAGMILSTSGMGIVTTVAVWLIYFGKKGEGFSFSKYFQPKTLLLLSILLVLVIVLYIKVPFFQNSIMRIVGSGYDYTNAISGRVDLGNLLIGQMRGMQLLIGVGDGLANIDFNMSGFNSTMYQYGIFGVILSYVFYLYGMIRLKGVYFWLSLIIIVLSFFSSHTHSTMFMIYCVFVYSDGFNKKRITNDLLSRSSQMIS